MSKTIQQTIEFEGVTADALFDTYLDPEKHSAAIGAQVEMDPRTGGGFTAYGDGYVRGRNLLISPKRLIVQAWRARIWEESDPDSILVLAFGMKEDRARIELVQANVPDQAYDIISKGWIEHYWVPWKAWFKGGQKM